MSKHICRSTVFRIRCTFVAVVLILAGLIVSGCSSRELNEATVEVVRPAEYSTVINPAIEYLSCSDPDVTLETEDVIDTSEVGSQTVHVKLSQGLFSRTEEVQIPVQDSEPPVIELDENAFDLEVGYEFDPTEHVKSVTDPVDGDLSPVTSEPDTEAATPGLEEYYEYGWYLIDNDVDTSASGTYIVEVTAADQHGNVSTADMTVTVIDPLDGVTVTPKEDIGPIEYSNSPLDPAGLVTCSDTETTFTVDALLPDQVGEITVPFHLAKHRSEREVDVPMVVQDTRAPDLRLRQWKVRVELGEKFTPDDYVKWAKDPVDGDLELVTKKPESSATEVGLERFYDQGFYFFHGSVNTEKAGQYKLYVNAYDQHGNRTTKRMRVTVFDPLENVKLTPKTDVLEYSQKKVDPTKLVACSVKGAKVEADKIDLSKVGDTTVRYTVTKGISTRTIDIAFKIRDTKGPNIALAATEKTITKGDSFRIESYIESVSDPVDGHLERVDREPSSNGEGWYLIDGFYDPDVVGGYYITVLASDSNGNRTSKEFKLVVTDPEPVDNARDYVINTNTRKFHHTWCGDINKMASHNRWDVHMTREEVVGMGYVPCKHCNP